MKTFRTSTYCIEVIDNDVHGPNDSLGIKVVGWSKHCVHSWFEFDCILSKVGSVCKFE